MLLVMSYRGYTSTGSMTTAQAVSKYIFYGTIVAAVCFVILIFFHYTSFGVFTLDPTSNAIITIPGNSNIIKSSYETSTIPVYLSTKFKDIGKAGGIVRQTAYTISFDVYIASSQNSGDYRVIFYNGKEIRDPGALPADDKSTGQPLTKTAGATSAVSVTPSDLSNIQRKLSTINTNICMYLSPDRNDLNLMYYTANVSPLDSSGTCGSSLGSGSWQQRNRGSAAGKIYSYNTNDLLCQESLGWIGPENLPREMAKNLTIENVPLQTPFRITLAVDPNFIEMYMNGNLVKTAKIPAKTELYVYSVEESSKINFMGPPDFSSFCKVGNIKYWDKVLPAKSIRVFSSTPADKKVFTQA